MLSVTTEIGGLEKKSVLHFDFIGPCGWKTVVSYMVNEKHSAVSLSSTATMNTGPFQSSGS
jgi:hypothetical protein